MPAREFGCTVSWRQDTRSLRYPLGNVREAPGPGPDPAKYREHVEETRTRTSHWPLRSPLSFPPGRPRPAAAHSTSSPGRASRPADNRLCQALHHPVSPDQLRLLVQECRAGSVPSTGGATSGMVVSASSLAEALSESARPVAVGRYHELA